MDLIREKEQKIFEAEHSLKVATHLNVHKNRIEELEHKLATQTEEHQMALLKIEVDTMKLNFEKELQYQRQSLERKQQEELAAILVGDAALEMAKEEEFSGLKEHGCDTFAAMRRANGKYLVSMAGRLLEMDTEGGRVHEVSAADEGERVPLLHESVRV